MNQDNIFKLLLIILLIGNNQSDCDCSCSSESSVNNVIILALLLGFISNDQQLQGNQNVTTF